MSTGRLLIVTDSLAAARAAHSAATHGTNFALIASTGCVDFFFFFPPWYTQWYTSGILVFSTQPSVRAVHTTALCARSTMCAPPPASEGWIRYVDPSSGYARIATTKTISTTMPMPMPIHASVDIGGS